MLFIYIHICNIVIYTYIYMYITIYITTRFNTAADSTATKEVINDWLKPMVKIYFQNSDFCIRLLISLTYHYTISKKSHFLDFNFLPIHISLQSSF